MLLLVCDAAVVAKKPPAALAPRPQGSYDPSTITAESDLRATEKSVLIMTTASVPWLTGTAINPLLRAAHLSSEQPA